MLSLSFFGFSTDPKLTKHASQVRNFVGLDVHDAGDTEKPIPVGAIFTVEPGVYLPAQGFGVRIEDEVLMTDHGYRMLTSSIPRKLEEVEAWIARARQRAR